MEAIRSWYFSNKQKKLMCGDGRDIAIGVEHTIKGPPKLGIYGLHGSRLILDALRYAPGPIVWVVDLSGRIKQGSDKIVATRRKYVAGGIDISDILQRFARSEALLVADKWECPEIVKRWLETGDEMVQLSAWKAAMVASHSARNSIVEFAARAAELSVTTLAIWSTTNAVARSAVRSTVDSIVQSHKKSVWDKIWSDDWLVANKRWDKTWSDVWLATNKRLETMVMDSLQ
jgi:hypothetical protein